MTGFDLFAPGGLALLVLLGLRVGGVLLIAPVFAARPVPVRVRAVLLVVLTLVLVPAAAAAADPAGGPARVTAESFFAESLIGFAIGLGAAVLIGAAEVAGDYMAMQMGLSSSSVLDPINQSPVPTLGQFANLFALTLFLALGGHLLLLEALAASVTVVPIGAGLDFEPGLGAMVALGGALFALGLRFAAPVIVAVMVGNLALGILSKAAPQFNVLIVAFPIQIGIGLFALAAALPLLAVFLSTWPSLFEGMTTTLFDAFGARP